MLKSPPFFATSSPGLGDNPRHVELDFASFCAEHLVDGLRLAGLLVIRPTPLRLTK
jgi:hypothetical protein